MESQQQPVQQSAPAGWYADPQQLGVQRWWDGYQWSSATQLAPPKVGVNWAGPVGFGFGVITVMTFVSWGAAIVCTILGVVFALIGEKQAAQGGGSRALTRWGLYLALGGFVLANLWHFLVR